MLRGVARVERREIPRGFGACSPKNLSLVPCPSTSLLLTDLSGFFNFYDRPFRVYLFVTDLLSRSIFLTILQAKGRSIFRGQSISMTDLSGLVNCLTAFLGRSIFLIDLLGSVNFFHRSFVVGQCLDRPFRASQFL